MNENACVAIVLLIFLILGIGVYLICSLVFGIKNYFYKKKKAQFYKDNPQAKILDEEVERTYKIWDELHSKKYQLKETIIKYYQEERVLLTRAKRNHKDEIMENLKAELELVEILYEMALNNYQKAYADRMALSDKY